MEQLIVMPKEELQTLIMDSVNACLHYAPSPKLPDNQQPAKPITRKELCEYLGITEPTIIRWERRGKIPVMRIGSAVRYDREAVIRALEAPKKKGGKHE